MNRIETYDDLVKEYNKANGVVYHDEALPTTGEQILYDGMTLERPAQKIKRLEEELRKAEQQARIRELEEQIKRANRSPFGKWL